MSNNDVFGEAGFGGGGKKTHWFKFPKEGGSLILRILPPYGSLKNSKTGWAKYYAIHFGYRDTKGNLRPFQSCEVVNRNTKMVEVADPAVERIKKIKMAQDKAKLEGNEDLVKKLGEQLKVFNVKKAYYMNVMDLQGKIGVISIPYKMKEALDAEIKALNAKGINPISANDGRFFVFTRTGFGANTTHKVTVYKEQVTMNGMEVEIDKKHALTPDVGSRIQSEGADLGKLYIAPTPEEIARIVSGTASDLEEVFAKYRSSNGGGSGSFGNGGEDDDESYVHSSFSSSPSVSSLKQQQSPEQQALTISVDDEYGKDDHVQQKTQTTSTVSSLKDISNMSNDEFLKMMGL
jgi:hypothetical protein